jgi:hypothetical protein
MAQHDSASLTAGRARWYTAARSPAASSRILFDANYSIDPYPGDANYGIEPYPA